MEAKIKERSSNIELLRIVLMLGIIILHYNGKAMLYSSGINKIVIYFLESIFVCAVDLFILITGYFMFKTDKRTFDKPIRLLVQVVSFKIVIYGLRVLIGKVDFSIKHIVGSIIPANYFVILYIALYFVSPYINIVISSLDFKCTKKLLIILIIIFSVYPTFVDIFSEITGKKFDGLSTIGRYGSQYGYTIINFLLMYTIGAFIKKYDDYNKASLSTVNHKLTPYIYIICLIILTFWGYLYNYSKEVSAMSQSVWEYCNPIVILLAVLTFYFFKNLKIKNNKFINELAKGSFTVFLLHGIFLSKLNIEKYVTGNTAIMIIHIISSAIGIYLICWLVYEIYSHITNPIFKLIYRVCPILTKDIISNN